MVVKILLVVSGTEICFFLNLASLAVCRTIDTTLL